MTEALDDDPLEIFQADARRRRRRIALLAVAAVVVGLGIGALAVSWREREIHLVASPEVVDAQIEGGPRFRLVAPHGAVIHLGPGDHRVRARRGPARERLRVPFAPWVSKLVAPVANDQCLVVASGRGFFEGGGGEVLIHEIAHEPREVGLPFLFSDVVVTHPCRLPPAVLLLDSVVLVTSFRCGQEPQSDGDARAAVRAAVEACAP